MDKKTMLAAAFSLALAISAGEATPAPGPRRNGIDKPVVFYGTSITHGDFTPYDPSEIAMIKEAIGGK